MLKLNITLIIYLLSVFGLAYKARQSRQSVKSLLYAIYNGRHSINYSNSAKLAASFTMPLVRAP